MYTIYRLNEDNEIFEIIENVLKIEKDDIYTTEGNIISGILENAIVTDIKYNLGDILNKDVENKIDDLKSVTDKEMINSLTNSLSVLNIDNKKKDIELNNLTKIVSTLNIENKKKDAMINNLVKTLASLNMNLNKLQGGE